MKKTEYKDLPVCPFCGHTIEDIWEFDFKDEQLYIDCTNCNKPLEIVEHRSITYSTYEN